jgi:hypothetical protein
MIYLLLLVLGQMGLLHSLGDSAGEVRVGGLVCPVILLVKSRGVEDGEVLLLTWQELGSLEGTSSV